MPIVASHSTTVAIRSLRILVVRSLAVAVLAVLQVVALGHVWLQGASRGWLPLPARGSALFLTLAAFEPAIVADAAVRAANAALESDASADRASNLLRYEYAQQLIGWALSRQPLQPKLWLLRAILLDHTDAGDAYERSVASVKMAYFTSSASGDFAVERLKAALKLKKIADAELSDLVRADITLLLLQRPDLRPVLAEIYRNASPAGQVFLVRAVGDMQPDSLSLLH